MRTGILAITAALTLRVAAAGAQGSPVFGGGLPAWADSALVRAGLGRHFELSSSLNPDYRFGDFDGDGVFDLAVQVVTKDGRQRGIAVVHHAGGAVHFLGAGRRMGNGKDELSALASWGVWSSEPGTGSSPKRDLIYIADPGSPMVWAVWDGTNSYTWVEDGG